MIFRPVLFLSLAAASICQAEPLVDFPTDNRAILEGRPQDFFMYVERNFEGEKSTPWQGGQFGYVRGPQRSGGKVIYTHLHEGIDISPVHRDAAGNPLDEVRAAASGKVVHTSKEAGGSNYGRYVVIEHRWEGSPIYTLYAHLSSISVEPGQMVRQGQPIGIMGFTGAGIDRPRSHVHFEVCFRLSDNFDSWHQTIFPGNPNKHGNFNGLNLVGIDPARLLLDAQANPNIRFSEAIAANEPAFKISVRNTPNFTLIRNYPWLVAPGEIANPPAWTITFNRHGAPLKIEASKTPITQPVATWMRDTGLPAAAATKGLVTGSSAAPKLTDSGMRFARLLTWPD
jgi:murein DD-endopeptidase MepM/ murein hydrolase activator NlpD